LQKQLAALRAAVEPLAFNSGGLRTPSDAHSSPLQHPPVSASSYQVSGFEPQVSASHPTLDSLTEQIAALRAQLSTFDSRPLTPRAAKPLPVYELKETRPVGNQPRNTIDSTTNEVLDGFYTSLLDRARIQWLSGDWSGLAKIDIAQISTNPDRAKLALFAAIGQMHIGSSSLAKKYLGFARSEGCPPRLIADVLASGIHSVLFQASLVAGVEKKALQHRDGLHRIGLLKIGGIPHPGLPLPGAQTLLPINTGSSIAATAVPWKILLAARSAVNSGEASSHAARFLANDSNGPTEKFLFLRQLALEFQSSGNKMAAAGFLEEASRHIPPDETDCAWRLVKDFLDLGLPDSAFELRLRIPEVGGRLSASDIESIRKAGDALGEKIRNLNGHGQELLLAFAKKHAQRLRENCGSRKPLLLEIGTTRESAAGQGSTRRLAEFCHSQGFHFITVDMDRANTDLAAQMFRENDYPYEAIHSKGEDFLAGYSGAIDLAFLDAYDFDHGKHTELRQARYEKFLGSRIDESECHRMHLECSRLILPLAAPWMLMCVDDTWLHEGRWTAKGTLAVPHLLENGYHFLDIRNRAVLMGSKYWLESLEPSKPY
jgi:hypothetical protein